jgi:hypothetical protein
MLISTRRPAPASGGALSSAPLRILAASRPQEAILTGCAGSYRTDNIADAAYPGGRLLFRTNSWCGGDACSTRPFRYRKGAVVSWRSAAAVNSPATRTATTALKVTTGPQTRQPRRRPSSINIRIAAPRPMWVVPTSLVGTGELLLTKDRATFAGLCAASPANSDRACWLSGLS